MGINKKMLASLLTALVVVSTPFVPVQDDYSSVVTVYAQGLEDDLDTDNMSVDNGVGDLFKNHQSLTPEQLESASINLSPITNIIGSLIGIGMVLVCALIFLVTVCDLIYIAVPFTRGLLYKGAQDEMQGNHMGYGGGYGGYGGGYARGGSSPQRGLKFQLISDEAVQCSALIGGGQQSAGGGMPGGYGGMMHNPASPQSEMSNKSVIFTYLKKRMVFMVIFGVCSVLLTSSLFLGTGVNIANWAASMIELINNSIPK